jgi:hypothetical protein
MAVVERGEEKRANIECVCVIAYGKFQTLGILDLKST